MTKTKIKSLSNILKLLNALILLTIILLTLPFLFAQEQPSSEITSPPIETAFQQDQKEFQDATLTTSAGITPDSPLYFIDNLLDNFASDASNREEKIAEIRDMIKAGNVDDAKKALSRYQQFAKRTEQDISPDQQIEARKSAVAISHVIKEIKDDIPQEHQQEFVSDILTQEEKISTAAKVADKIKTLCETLSKLDPQQYAATCKIKDDETAPQWQRSLDKKLTQEQQQEARAFFKTMSSCMRNPANCQCDEITIKPFAQKCNVIAPLAAKCQQGDQASCDAMDKDTQNIEDLLPPHLQEIMQELEQDFEGAEFENHMPKECQQANIDPKSSNAREQCEAIIFQQNAPEECVQAGLKDHKECGKYMFNLKAPPECKDAGLTGESQKDARQCEKIMQELQRKQEQERQNNNPAQNNNFNNNRGPGMGFSLGKNCKDLTDQTEKLQCLEQFYNQAQQQQNNFAQNQQEFQNQQGEYPPSQFQNNFDPSRAPPECRDTKSPEECRKIMDEKSRQDQQEFENAQQPYPQPQNPDQSQQQYQQPPYPEGQQPPNMPPSNIMPPPNQQPPSDQQQQPPPNQPSSPPSTFLPEASPLPPSSPPPSSSPEHSESSESKDSSSYSPDRSSSSGSSESSSSSSSSSESSSSSGNSAESSPLTGNAIIENKFLKYYWKKW